MPEGLWTPGLVSRPEYQDKTKVLLEIMKGCQPWDLEAYLKINEKLAGQAFQDFQAFDQKAAGTPALLTFDGLVFKYLAPETLTKEELLYGNEHLRILCAFYGILKPLDGILPYRMDMQCRIKVGKRSLYQFWGAALYESLYRTGEIVVNLASEEFSKCIRRYLKPEDRFIDVEFLNWRKGKLRTTVTPAKMARGSMARYLIRNRIGDPSELKKFDWDGYTYQSSLSDSSKYVFVKS